MQCRIPLQFICRMAPVVSWVRRDEKEEEGLDRLEAPIREEVEVSRVWAAFDDEVEDE